MRHLTASQKISSLERRVAKMEKQAIFGLFKSKEEKERARDIENLQREVSRADKMSLKQIKALKTAIEDLWVDPDYIKEHKGAIQSMIRDIVRTLKRKEKEEKDRPVKNLQREVSRADNLSLRQLEDLKDRIEGLEYDPDYAEYEQALQSMIEDVEKILYNKKRDTVVKKFFQEMMRAKSYPEFFKLSMEALDQDVIGVLRVEHREEIDGKEADLFARYLLGFYNPNFELNVRGKAYKKGFVTFGDRKHKISYGRDRSVHSALFLEINEEVIFGGEPNITVSYKRDVYGILISNALKAR